MIDVSYRYKRADLNGGKMMMDPETGAITLVGANEEPEQQPVPVPVGMTVEQEQQFEQAAKPTKPTKPAKVKGHG